MATAEARAPAMPHRDPSPRLWSEAEFARMRQLGVFGTRDVELRAGVVCDRDTGRPFVFTRKEYYALDDNHFFRDQRVQLIGGNYGSVSAHGRDAVLTPLAAPGARVAVADLLP